MKSLITLMAVLFCPILLAQEEARLDVCYDLADLDSDFLFAEKICFEAGIVALIQIKESGEKEATILEYTKEENEISFFIIKKEEEEVIHEEQLDFKCVLKENQLLFTAIYSNAPDEKNLKEIAQSYVLTEEKLYQVLNSEDSDLIYRIDNNGDTLVVVEQMPEFPGGQRKMLEFLYGNIVYPPIARENGIDGMVVVSFIVMEDGSLSDIEIKRDIGGGCGQEAVRVIRSMPKWLPGMQKGEAVRVRYNLPVRFKLQNPKKEKKKKKKKRG